MNGAFTRAEEIALEQGAALPVTRDGFGPACGPQNTARTVDLTDIGPVFRGTTLQPDFQQFIRPGASTNTAVPGFRNNVNP